MEMTLVENIAWAWVACVPVCALLGAVMQLLLPRDWPKACLAIVYVSLGSAAVFVVRGLILSDAPNELNLVVFDALGFPLAFAISSNRLLWCLLGLALAIGWILLHATQKTHGQDAALSGSLIGFGVAVMSLSGHPMLEALGLATALGAMVLTSVPGEPRHEATSRSSLGVLLLASAVGLSLLSLPFLPPTMLSNEADVVFVKGTAEVVNYPGEAAASDRGQPGSTLALALAARVLAFAVIVLLLWRCKQAMEAGAFSRWSPLVILGLGIVLIRPIPLVAFGPLETPFWQIVLIGLGTAAGLIVLLVLYTRPKVHGTLGVIAELLNQVPMLLLEFVRLLIVMPVSKIKQALASRTAKEEGK